MSAYTRYRDDDIEHVGGIRYQLKRDLIWRIGNQFGPVYVVPAHFEFEVSVPLVLRWIISPHNRRFLKAAALHDHMLECGKTDEEIRTIQHKAEDDRPEAFAEEVLWSREEAGGSFGAALKADRVRYFKRLAAHVGVVIWTTR